MCTKYIKLEKKNLFFSLVKSYERVKAFYFTSASVVKIVSIPLRGILLFISNQFFLS